MRFRSFVLTLFLSSSLPGLLWAQETPRPRVYVEESNTWEITGELGGFEDGLGGGLRGGGRPQTAEIIKTFNQRCPDYVITQKKDKADYVVLLQREGGKDLVRKDNKFVVFNRDGDALASGSTRVLGNAVKNACAAIIRDVQTGWPKSKKADPPTP